MPRGSRETRDPRQDRFVAGVGPVTQFAAQAQVQTVRRWFLGVIIADEVPHPKP
jgi:hypothetical protein